MCKFVTTGITFIKNNMISAWFLYFMYIFWFYLSIVMIFLSLFIWEDAMGRRFCIQGLGNILCAM